MALETLQGIKIMDSDPGNLSNNSNINHLTSILASLQKEEPAVSSSDNANQKEREENVRQLVADCKKLLVDLSEDCYGNWALIDSSE